MSEQKQPTYQMRQIQLLVMNLSKVLFHKNMVAFRLPDPAHITTVELLFRQLCIMLSQGQINEAENLLFDQMNPQNPRYLELAIDFFARVNQFDDAFLEEHDYSREEIEEGILDAARQYGVKIG